MSDLTIIILNYNGQYWLKKTLASLKENYLDHSRRTIEVVVVDNQSSDDSVSLLKKEFKWVKLMELPENVGFAAGNNMALRQVKSTYVMLLNSDVEFGERSNLDPLLTYLDEHEQVGVITPKLILNNGQLDWASHRGEPTLWAAFSYYVGLEKMLPQLSVTSGYHQKYKNLQTVHQVDACSGAAMIVRSAAIKKVGLLDERFFFYAEDLDWCKRFREAGYQIVFSPEAVLIHHKNKSGMGSESGEVRRKTSHHFYDTMLQYYDKHYREEYPEFVRSGLKYLLTIKKGDL